VNGTLFLSTWLPQAAANHAEGFDPPMRLLIGAAIIALVFFVGVAATMVMSFRRRDESARGDAGAALPRGLMFAWLLAAAGLGALALGAGFTGWVGRATAPFAATEVAVSAGHDGWTFDYGDEATSDTLHVPVGEPIKLILHSDDVLHDLSIPAFRVGQVARPDRETEAWFTADRPGVYPLVSRIYGGESWPSMCTVVVAENDVDFDAWLASISDIFTGRTLPEVGELLYTRHGCAACHSLDGTTLIGPSFVNVYGHEFDTADGARITADDAYIRESILDPNVSVIAGFQPVMTPYAGVLGDREIEALTEWLKTLSDRGGADGAQEVE